MKGSGLTLALIAALCLLFLFVGHLFQPADLSRSSKEPEKEQRFLPAACCFLSSFPPLRPPPASVVPPCETKLISNLTPVVWDDTPSLLSNKSKLTP